MNYCVSARQQPEVLKQAEEIMVDYKDRDILYDFIQDYENKKYIIRIPKDEEIDWAELKTFNSKTNIVLAIEDLTIYKQIKKDRFKFFWAYPITSYYELKGILDLGVSEVLLGAPLYFDLVLKDLKNVNVRLVANLCFEDYIPREDGITGTYVRPEDVDYYERYVGTLEFRTDSLSKEAKLMEIYKRKSWNGNLNLLLTNLKFDVHNRAIPKEFAAARSQCRQVCMRNGSCHLCENSIRYVRAVDQYRKNSH